MQDTLPPVLQTSVTTELQNSRFTKTCLLSMTEIKIAGLSVRRLGCTAQSRRSCAGCFSLKIGTDCGIHTENVPVSHIWSRVYNLWSHDFYDGNVGILSRSWCQNRWNTPDSWNRAFGLDWGRYLVYWCVFFSVLLPVEALALVRVVRGLRRLRTASGSTFTTEASLWRTASFIYRSFNFFLDGENDIGKEITLRHRRTGQIVN